MAKGYCKCGTLKENPKASYCRKCGREWANAKRAKDPESARQRERDAIANMTPDEKVKYWERKRNSQAKRMANPEKRARVNETARDRRKNWTPEQKAQSAAWKKEQKARLKAKRAAGICSYSDGCSEPIAGTQAHCLLHWLERKRHADLRGKKHYTAEQMLALWNSQGGRCAISGVPLIPGDTAEIDHIIPICRKGSLGVSNLRFVHRHINKLKWHVGDSELAKIVLEIVPGLHAWAKKIVDIKSPQA